jgi:hypothetical protein
MKKLIILKDYMKSNGEIKKSLTATKLIHKYIRILQTKLLSMVKLSMDR